MNFFHDIFNILFPKSCLICGKEVERKEQLFCFYCLSDLPLTQFCCLADNRLENSFRATIPVRTATSLVYFYKKGPVQKIMHLLKYHNKQEIGSFFGDWLGVNAK